jgi:biopolymer transport protein ExbB
MISTFEVICQFGTGNAQALAGGISQALITTETGLLIAVPGLFTAYMMRRRIRREQQKLLGLKESVERWIRGKEAVTCFS